MTTIHPTARGLPIYDPDVVRAQLRYGLADASRSTSEAVPTYLSHVEDARRRWPELWAVAHFGGPQTEGFIRMLGSSMHHTVDGRVGLNGKRGSETDISDDGLAILDPNSPIVDMTTGKHFAFIDCIAGAGSTNASPSWQNISGTGPSAGVWIKPSRIHDGTGPGPVDPSIIPPVKPVIVPYAGDEYYIREMGVPMAADYAEGHQTMNGGSAAWWGRVFHDAFIGDHTGKKLTPAESMKKHRNAWRLALGLQPL